MTDKRYRDSAWGQPPAAHWSAPAAPASSGGGEVPASPPIASSGPEIDKSGPSGAAPPPAQIAQDGWGRPPATVGTSQRDDKGRFLPGNSGNGGRPKGSRNRLTSMVLSTLAADFDEHGADAVAKLREKDPAAYLQMAINLIPRQLIAQQETLPDFESWEEVNEFIEQAKRKRMIEIALEELNKDHPTITKD